MGRPPPQSRLAPGHHSMDNRGKRLGAKGSAIKNSCPFLLRLTSQRPPSADEPSPLQVGGSTGLKIPLTKPWLLLRGDKKTASANHPRHTIPYPIRPSSPCPLGMFSMTTCHNYFYPLQTQLNGKSRVEWKLLVTEEKPQASFVNRARKARRGVRRASGSDGFGKMGLAALGRGGGRGGGPGQSQIRPGDPSTQGRKRNMQK